MKVDFSREVNCPQQVAFEYYSDRDKDLEWWSGTLKSETKNRGRVGEKTHQVQRMPGLPVTFEIDIEVIAWEPPHRWREVCRNALTTYDVWYVVEKIDERRSRVKLVGTCELNGVFKLLYPFAKALLVRLSNANFDRLKEKLDALGAQRKAA